MEEAAAETTLYSYSLLREISRSSPMGSWGWIAILALIFYTLRMLIQRPQQRGNSVTADLVLGATQVALLATLLCCGIQELIATWGCGCMDIHRDIWVITYAHVLLTLMIGIAICASCPLLAMIVERRFPNGHPWITLTLCVAAFDTILLFSMALYLMKCDSITYG